MAFKTMRSTLGSQQNSYQGFIIWFYGKTILKKRIPGSLYWQSSTFEGLSLPITKITQKSQQQHPFPSIQPYQWLGPPFHQ